MKMEKLLAKHVVGLTNEEEERTIQAWRDEDASHEAYFQKLQSRHNYSEMYRVYKESHPQMLPQKPTFNWKRVIYIAAMFALPLLIAASLWYGLHSSADSNEILPGTAKATLYLENGAVVELGNSKELGWIRICDDLMASDENGNLSYKNCKSEVTDQRNVLATPRGGEYHIILPDGTKIHLNSLSELTYPLSFDKDKRVVYLSGEAYFEVAKDARPFYVFANGLIIRQYGTKFSVNARSSQVTTVALEEGSIGVFTSHNSKARMLNVGEAVLWNEKTKTVTTSDKSIESFTGWHHNRFVFEDESLGKIMETLSLWYNMDVRFQDVNLANLHFTGNVSRYEDIRVILKGVETTVNVQFQIKDRQIKIMKKQ